MYRVWGFRWLEVTLFRLTLLRWNETSRVSGLYPGLNYIGSCTRCIRAMSGKLFRVRPTGYNPGTPEKTGLGGHVPTHSESLLLILKILRIL